MMANQFYAHTLEDKPASEWQPVDVHLKAVAALARQFATPFHAGDWAYLAGLWHDMGKYSIEFQRRIGVDLDKDAHIELLSGRPDHSTAGARHAAKQLKDTGKILAYVIAGHHAGLPDGKSTENSSLTRRLDDKRKIPDFSACPEEILSTRPNLTLPFLPDMKRAGVQLSIFIRMLYSCLVDADFLDTEQFMDADRTQWRQGYPSLETLDEKLTRHLEKLISTASDTPINQHRRTIHDQCLAHADNQPGLFSLTVPTGGGKTLSSLAFALKHARRYNMKRIIYVIPFTSIIEQNAAVFRNVLGENAVLEHHSNFEPKNEDRRSRLAAENWDAPLVVTTNVQFFESLFHHKSSRCRKIHNIANSVVILDEAQMLPVPLLRPCLEALREISDVYGTTVVLCTATQPALLKRDDFPWGLDNVREIISEPGALYQTFRRVHTEYLGQVSDADIAARLLEHHQVLCVVNTRKHARLLYEQMEQEEGIYHLSALMCPIHRSEKLKEIREALASGLPCRVVSTQLIEAGVDIDFPVVYRAAGGIDSIAQAAGRCNREGLLPENGHVYVFMPEHGLPPGDFRLNAETAEMVFRHHEDILSLDAVREYFELLYWRKGAEQLDAEGILSLLQEDLLKGNFPFREVSKRFRLISTKMESVIIPRDKDSQRLVEQLRYVEFPGAILRKLQRYTVQIPFRVLAALTHAGSVEGLDDNEFLYVLRNMELYKPDMGLCPDDPAFHEAEHLIF